MITFSSLHLGHGPTHLFPYAQTKNYFQRRTTCRDNLFRFIPTSPKVSISSNSHSAERYYLASLAPLEAILFDIDGTLCDSDPLHYYAFREMLQEIDFNDGNPITEEFFIEKIAGKHNVELSRLLFPDWDLSKGLKFMDDKEAMFRRQVHYAYVLMPKLAADQLKSINGLKRLCKWIEDRGLKRGAVTNAPRPNAELLLSSLGLSDYFETVVIANECDRAKPFPDPYLKGLKALKASPDHTLVFEDSVSGIKAGVAAGMPVLGITTRNPEHLLMEAGATFLIKDYDDPKLWTELEALESEASETVASRNV
ncbi:hypothetical protein IFM89_036339 [Coptis chinensis]|uniref:Haloacid dehalogenase-like hydrolase domain-containing protein Sgpp n=1 Tax=Coptis chinensis TaxID=261450 RepID=A0A835IIY2_9MAGN|nr:hypothetical protein IFM89_036339 [Coptis chinensis]